MRFLAALLLLLVSRLGYCATWEVNNQVEITHGKLSIDHTKSLEEITRAQAQGGFPASYGLGLFQNRMRMELLFEAPETALTNRRLQMRTRIITAPVIYIAQEFAVDSCAYQVVLEHELLHQLYDLEVLRALPQEIRAITRQVFSPDALDWQRPLDLDAARRRFFQQLNYVYDGRSFPRHARIDNPASYRAAGSLCNGEISRLLGERAS